MVIKYLLAVLPFLTLSALAADPTRPPGWGGVVETESRPQPLPELTLQQIRVSASDAVAVINNQLVRVGDRIDGAQIIAIKNGVVTIKIQQKRQELSLLNHTRQSSE